MKRKRTNEKGRKRKKEQKGTKANKSRTSCSRDDKKINRQAGFALTGLILDLCCPSTRKAISLTPLESDFNAQLGFLTSPPRGVLTKDYSLSVGWFFPYQPGH